MAKRGRPKASAEERVQVAWRCPVSLHERLREVADDRETSVNHLVVKAIEKYLDHLPSLEPIREGAP